MYFFSLQREKGAGRAGQTGCFTIGAIMLGILGEAFIPLLGDSGWFAEGEEDGSEVGADVVASQEALH